jgi:hypothetical protein
MKNTLKYSNQTSKIKTQHHYLTIQYKYNTKDSHSTHKTNKEERIS